MVKNLPAMQETWVRPLGWEDPLEKGKATYSSILENCMDCIVHGVTGGIKNSFFFFPTSPGDRKNSASGLVGEANGNPLQLESPRDRGAWWAAVYGVA